MMLSQVLPHLDSFEHVICSLSSKGPIGEKLEKSGFKVYHLESGKNFSPRAILKFRQIIKKEHPDMLSTRLIHADIFGRIFGRIFGVKKIYCCLESILDHPKYKKYFLIEQVTSFLVTRYIAVSDAVKNKYVKTAKINPNKINVIYNGIDLKRFEDLPSKTECKKMLGFENSYPLIGYVSKLRPERNHLSLLKAFSIATKKLPSARLILAGDGLEKEKLITSAKEMKLTDKIFFWGNRNDVPYVLAALDIYVSLSAYEGMSVAMLEAMASGLPIIASDIEPNRELIENRKNGILVPPYGIETIAEKIIKLAEDSELQKKLSVSAKEKSKTFSIENTVNSLKRFYNSTI